MTPLGNLVGNNMVYIWRNSFIDTVDLANSQQVRADAQRRSRSVPRSTSGADVEDLFARERSYVSELSRKHEANSWDFGARDELKAPRRDARACRQKRSERHLTRTRT
eukprot:CAMPEP_0170405492 /NCGR_PEP_ID=MMETSP0117_2-20130122/27206_1 /TAXON_ID=400756 /ORGANISM="Durinskia baltica, Strain CSIRO CS-38" /LENGTH=107 /DNA_ID=CAMNT_0010662603 /DNA_START=44 /DNA_END=364 /DNA_ORIENTATION=-